MVRRPIAAPNSGLEGVRYPTDLFVSRNGDDIEASGSSRQPRVLLQDGGGERGTDDPIDAEAHPQLPSLPFLFGANERGALLLGAYRWVGEERAVGAPPAGALAITAATTTSLPEACAQATTPSPTDRARAKDLYRQGTEPVANAEYVLVTPKSRTFYIDTTISGLTREVKESSTDRTYRFFAKNVPALAPRHP